MVDDEPEDDDYEPPAVEVGDVDVSARANKLKGKHAAYYESKAKRQALLAAVKGGETSLVDACRELGINYDTYKKWRQRWPQFAHEIDAARVSQATDLAVGWKKGFAEFRKAYFGMDSPWFHLEIIDALENSEPGSITLVLIPPRHGKTTLLEDFCNYKLAIDPTFRIGYGSERKEHGEKVLNRVRGRMEEDGSAREYVAAFGPLAPQTGASKNDARKSTQPWGSTKFNVYKKGNHDERDYSMAAAGVLGSIQGARFDLLILDDMQGTKNMNLTDSIMEKLRQDWFTRPGPEDRIVIIGTRVSEDDIYQRLMDEENEEGEPLLGRVIVYPAIKTDFHTGEPVYLWPEVYTPKHYKTMENRAGPSAWARNYQQRPQAAGASAFTEEVLANGLDKLRSWETPMPEWVKELCLTIDPALGGQNAITVQGWGDEKMMVLDTAGQWGLSRTEQIMQEADNLLGLWQGRQRADGTPVHFTTVVIEEMAFQRGLPNDDRMKELQSRYGFFIVPHQTGRNKNDAELGITGMALSMMRGELLIPFAQDEMTVARLRPLVDELRKWRAGKRGTKLKQDRVMALWFGWLHWRQRKGTLTDARPTAPKGAGLPFRPMTRPVMPKPTLWTPAGTRR